MRSYCARARRAGYAINDGLMMPEMGAIGMVIRGPRGTACGALSIAALKSRIQPLRRATLVRLLRHEVARLESLLAAPPSNKSRGED